MAPSKDEWPSDGEDKWVQFYNIDSLTVQGDGRFNGQGSSWWNKDCHNHCNRPTVKKKFNLFLFLISRIIFTQG